MATFSIGEIEKLTGIKAHILRYWEEVVPSLTPQKDLGGRRTYSQRDVQIILRLKHLIQEKKWINRSLLLTRPTSSCWLSVWQLSSWASC